MPPEYCADLQTAEPPVEEPPSCYYSDGTPVITGPPTDGDCPASDPRMPFCGGACGLRFCPTYEDVVVTGPPQTRFRDCVGLSDDRGFGICAFQQARCVRGSANAFVLESCTEDMGERCVCLVPRPQPEGELPEHGYVVIESVCREYADQFPDHAECVDRDWQPLED